MYCSYFHLRRVSSDSYILEKIYFYFSYATYLNSIFQLNFTKYEKKVMTQNCLLNKDLQVRIAIFYHKMYIFLSNLKKYYWKSKIQFFNNNMWNSKKKEFCKIVRLNKIQQIMSDIVSDKIYILYFNFKKYD